MQHLLESSFALVRECMHQLPQLLQVQSQTKPFPSLMQVLNQVTSMWHLHRLVLHQVTFMWHLHHTLMWAKLLNQLLMLKVSSTTFFSFSNASDFLSNAILLLFCYFLYDGADAILPGGGHNNLPNEGEPFKLSFKCLWLHDECVLTNCHF